MKDLQYYVTLWPSFPHFEKFAKDDRLSGIRLNSAMIKIDELHDELEIAKGINGSVPLYFDIKGRQLRVTESHAYPSHLELTLNHPVEVKTPTMVLFKAGEDYCLLRDVKDDGRRLVFEGGPEYMVHEGESLHIRDPSLRVNGPTFLPYEIEKIQKARAAGFDRFFLSYVESQRDIDEFRDYVGDSEIVAKIENQKGLNYVANEFRPQDGLSLLAARGDLYVELEKPHEIMDAMKLIVDKDPTAGAGSRYMLSMINGPVPSCADFMDLAWTYDVGYRKIMLCDELCLKDPMLSNSVNVLEAFRNNYAQDTAPIAPYVPAAASPLYEAPKAKRSLFDLFKFGR